MKQKPNTVVFTDDENNEIKVQLLFSIVRPETGIRYLFVADPDDEDGVLVFQSDNDEEGDISLVDESAGKDVVDYLNATFTRYESNELEPVEASDEEDEEDDQEDDEYEYGTYEDKEKADSECCDDCCDCCGSCDKE